MRLLGKRGILNIMSIAERKEREKEELRNKILNSAAEIVTEAGFNNLKIRDLAARIDYSPRTVYLYFPDKSALLEAVIENGFKFTVSQMEKMELTDSTPPEEILIVLIKNHVKMAFSNPNYYRAVVTLNMDKNFHRGVYQQKVIDRVKKILNLYFAETAKEQDEIELLTDILISCLRGFTLKLINQNEKMDQSEIENNLRIFTTFIFKGLKDY